jgi:carbon storage regulator
MLVLTRYIDESIIINDNIKITVIDIQGKQVRLGIEAPIDIDVHREEIYNKIQAELSERRD